MQASPAPLFHGGLGSAADHAVPVEASLSVDGWLILLARFMRLFSYGWLAVGLIGYLVEIGQSQLKIGMLFTCILLGDLFMTTLLTAISDQWGRRRTLLLASVLKIVAGVVFAFQRSFAGLLVAGFVGIISPTGGEVGPFLVIEQNCLTEAVARPEDITKVFGWSVAGTNE